MKLCLAAYKNRLASLFDNCTNLLLFQESSPGFWEQIGEIRVPEKSGDFLRARLLLEHGVQVLICGAMSGCTKRLLQSAGVQVLDWMRGEIQEVLGAWQQGELSALLMPGCRRKGRRAGNCQVRSRSRKQGSRSPGRNRQNAFMKEVNSMKVAVSSQGNDLDSGLDPRFGRAVGFIIYDLDTQESQFISNEQNLYASQGAGIQTAQNVAKTGVQAVITGHVGPKAFSALQAGGIPVYLCQSGTVQEALQAYEQGRLQQAEGADKAGHWQ
ncbi:MAG: NifB/NifX family molybdenum-iron cluster-binding protein [Desulfohalobiaceae bacterium]